MGPAVSSAAAANAAGIADAFPHVWRADQLASFHTHSIPTGHPLLDRELPERGWPAGTLIELLIQQAGIGEMTLLQPALRQVAHRTIALVQPPHAPQAAAWATNDFPVERMMWVQTRRTADALWAAEQILRNGSCGALLFWPSHVRNESLRRLHLAAQSANTIFWLLRPLAAAQDASPAPLRLALRPAAGGIRVDIVKRRGPGRDDFLHLPLAHMPADFPNIIEPHHAPVDRPASAAIAAGNVPSALV